MTIKTYVAESAAAALKNARAEMGGEAVVLKTRRLQTGTGNGQVEVTVCIHNDKDGRKGVTETKNRLVSQVIQSTEKAVVTPAESKSVNEVRRWFAEVNGKLDQLLKQRSVPTRVPASNVPGYDMFRESDVSSRFLAHLIGNEELSESQIIGRLSTFVEKHIASEISVRPGDSILVYGPAGSGKSTVLHKLASFLVHSAHQPVRIQTLESFSASQSIQTPADDRTGKTPITLIDTPAIGRNTTSMEAIIAVKATVNLLVVSAQTRTVDVEDLLDSVASFKPTALVFTMVDQTTRWGGLLSALAITESKLLYCSDSSESDSRLSHPRTENIIETLSLGGQRNAKSDPGCSDIEQQNASAPTEEKNR